MEEAVEEAVEEAEGEAEGEAVEGLRELMEEEGEPKPSLIRGGGNRDAPNTCVATSHAVSTSRGINATKWTSHSPS